MLLRISNAVVAGSSPAFPTIKKHIRESSSDGRARTTHFLLLALFKNHKSRCRKTALLRKYNDPKVA
jgi:hypothetical protein